MTGGQPHYVANWVGVEPESIETTLNLGTNLIGVATVEVPPQSEPATYTLQLMDAAGNARIRTFRIGAGTPSDRTPKLAGTGGEGTGQSGNDPAKTIIYDETIKNIQKALAQLADKDDLEALEPGETDGPPGTGDERRHPRVPQAAVHARPGGTEACSFAAMDQ